MQLIVESETALDIERNMSTTEGMQNNKLDNLDIGELNDKKCNGNNKITENSNSKDEENKQVIDEIEEAFTNSPMAVENDEAGLSNVDLSNIISKLATPEPNGGQTDESQNDYPEEESNGVDIVEKERINEAEEDDYMEDDIISIREEPYDNKNTDLQPETQNDHAIINETTLNEENRVDKSNKIEKFEETNDKSTVEEESWSLDEEKDMIEVFDESQDSNEYEKAMRELLTDEEKDDFISEKDIIEEPQDDAHIEQKKDTEPALKEKHDIELTGEKLRDSADVCERTSEIPHVKKDSVEDIEESNNTVVENKMETEPIPEKEGNIQVTEETDKSVALQSENNDDTEPIVKDKIEPVEETKDTSILEDKIEPIEEAEDTSIVKDKIEPDEETEDTSIVKDKIEPDEETEDTSIVKDKIEPDEETEDTSIVKDVIEPVEETEDTSIVKDKIEPVEETKDTSIVKDKIEPVEKTQDTSIVRDNIEPVEETMNTSIVQDKIQPVKETMDTSIVKDKIEPVEETMDISNVKDTIEPVEESKDTSIECEDDLNQLIDADEKDKNTVADESEIIVAQKEESCGQSLQEEKESKIIEEANQSVLPNNEPDNNEEEDLNETDNCNKTESSKLATDKVFEESQKELDAVEQNTDVPCPVQKDVAMDVEDIVDGTKHTSDAAESHLNGDMDVDEVVEKPTSDESAASEDKKAAPVTTAPVNNIDKPIICKLSNTLNILSDDEEEELLKEKPPKTVTPELPVSSPKVADTKEKQSINIEDDDDIMLIDEDTNKTEVNAPLNTDINIETEVPIAKPDVTDSETGEKTFQEPSEIEKTPPPVAETKDDKIEIDISPKSPETVTKPASPTPLLPENFLKTAKKKLSDMTRDEIEEFCILKIVESIVDRSSLSDIKNKLKAMSQGLEEYRKKALMLTKQNRDLQVVLKSVQEEQKKSMGDTPITPLKITRSVGMQVFMEKTGPRKKGQPQQNANNKPIPINNPQNRNVTPQGPRPQKPVNQQIPVPRLVPANNPSLKTPCTITQLNQMNNQNKTNNVPNGLVKNPSPAAKAEKRPHNKIASSSVTVDLTDDEPPAKMPGGPKTSPAPPVRLVPPQNLMAQQRPFSTAINSPRKVYIPISGPQNAAIRPGQTIMLKTVPAPGGMRPRLPTPQMTRVEPNAVRMNRVAARHPAPLPSCMKQYQPPNWKGLPPAPDLKLSKVENGIVISWKIEGVPEDTYEEIASYQLYAYQETSSPPSTALWKKIGDVKALPLPMACTLTQFMAGFKYYFAVRAVDVRSRLGPFSLPGSILLLSKNI